MNCAVALLYLALAVSGGLYAYFGLYPRPSSPSVAGSVSIALLTDGGRSLLRTATSASLEQDPSSQAGTTSVTVQFSPDLSSAQALFFTLELRGRVAITDCTIQVRGPSTYPTKPCRAERLPNVTQIHESVKVAPNEMIYCTFLVDANDIGISAGGGRVEAQLPRFAIGNDDSDLDIIYVLPGNHLKDDWSSDSPGREP